MRRGLIALSGAICMVPTTAIAAGAPSGSVRNPYICGSWTTQGTRGSGLIGAQRGAKVPWKSKSGACAYGKKQMKHAYWPKGGLQIPGWKCSSQFGTATCTRSRIEILFVFQ
jgi:hypothetical protein